MTFKQDDGVYGVEFFDTSIINVGNDAIKEEAEVIKSSVASR